MIKCATEDMYREIKINSAKQPWSIVNSMESNEKLGVFGMDVNGERKYKSRKIGKNWLD